MVDVSPGAGAPDGKSERGTKVNGGNWKPGRQAHGLQSRRKGGAGLGLYLVRRLVDVLGGSIDVASEVGRGTTFRVRVPQAASGAREA